jgi:hypothetical protein
MNEFIQQPTTGSRPSNSFAEGGGITQELDARAKERLCRLKNVARHSYAAFFCIRSDSRLTIKGLKPSYEQRKDDPDALDEYLAGTGKPVTVVPIRPGDLSIAKEVQSYFILDSAGRRLKKAEKELSSACKICPHFDKCPMSKEEYRDERDEPYAKTLTFELTFDVNQYILADLFKRQIDNVIKGRTSDAPCHELADRARLYAKTHQPPEYPQK